MTASPIETNQVVEFLNSLQLLIPLIGPIACGYLAKEIGDYRIGSNPTEVVDHDENGNTLPHSVIGKVSVVAEKLKHIKTGDDYDLKVHGPTGKWIFEGEPILNPDGTPFISPDGRRAIHDHHGQFALGVHRYSLVGEPKTQVKPASVHPFTKAARRFLGRK